jgi:hypothetical protein
MIDKGDCMEKKRSWLKLLKKKPQYINNYEDNRRDNNWRSSSTYDPRAFNDINKSFKKLNP